MTSYNMCARDSLRPYKNSQHQTKLQELKNTNPIFFFVGLNPPLSFSFRHASICSWQEKNALPQVSTVPPTDRGQPGKAWPQARWRRVPQARRLRLLHEWRHLLHSIHASSRAHSNHNHTQTGNLSSVPRTGCHSDTNNNHGAGHLSSNHPGLSARHPSTHNHHPGKRL